MGGRLLLAAAVWLIWATAATSADVVAAVMRARAATVRSDARDIERSCGPSRKFDPNAMASSENELRLDICFMLVEQNAAIDLRRLTHDLCLQPYGSDDPEVAAARRDAVAAARSLFNQAAAARSIDGSELEKPMLATEAARFWLVTERDGLSRSDAAALSARLCSEKCLAKFIADRPTIDVPAEPGPHGDAIDGLFARAAVYLALQDLRPRLDLNTQTEDALAALQHSDFDREVLNDAALDLAQARAMIVRLRARGDCGPTSLCARLQAAEDDMAFQAGLRLP